MLGKQAGLVCVSLRASGAATQRVCMGAGVNGWIGERKDYARIWASLAPADSEVFSLVWEVSGKILHTTLLPPTAVACAAAGLCTPSLSPLRASCPCAPRCSMPWPKK